VACCPPRCKGRAGYEGKRNPLHPLHAPITCLAALLCRDERPPPPLTSTLQSWTQREAHMGLKPNSDGGHVRLEHGDGICVRGCGRWRGCARLYLWRLAFSLRICYLYLLLPGYLLRLTARAFIPQCGRCVGVLRHERRTPSEEADC
jgi:hypothetical protein